MRVRLWRAAVILAVVGTVALIVVRKQGCETVGDAGYAQALTPAVSHTPARTSGIPRLVDVGADSCIPCKLMAPILTELTTECAGRMRVEFIDVWKNPGAGEPYGVFAIPTQIFYGADGRELARHQGFMSKADILTTWDTHGYDFSGRTADVSRN